jgi:hypothetical protein
MPGPPPLIETATGDLALPFVNAATLLSQSPTFQAMVGHSGDATTALTFIDYPLRDVASYGWPVPGAIITDDDSLTVERKRLGHRSGQFVIQLLDEMNPTYWNNGTNIDWRNDDIAMRSRFGSILKEILVQTPALAVASYRKIGSPTHLGPPDFLRADSDSGQNDPDVDDQRWFRYGAFLIDWV